MPETGKCNRTGARGADAGPSFRGVIRLSYSVSYFRWLVSVVCLLAGLLLLDKCRSYFH